MDEARERHKYLVGKIRQMLSFLNYLNQLKGNAPPNFEEDVPRLIASAEEACIEDQSTSDALAKLRDSGSENNDLKRSKTIRNIPSMGLNAPPPQTLLSSDSLVSESLIPSSSTLSIPFTNGLDSEGNPIGEEADMLVRNTSLQSFMDAMETFDQTDKVADDRGSQPFGECNDLARGVSELINEQDDTFKKISSLTSSLSVDKFLDNLPTSGESYDVESLNRSDTTRENYDSPKTLDVGSKHQTSTSLSEKTKKRRKKH